MPLSSQLSKILTLPWFKRLGDAINQLRHDDGNKPKRLVLVQHALIDLIDLLDPHRERFDKDRERIASP
jgi:hypothetical protein